MKRSKQAALLVKLDDFNEIIWPNERFFYCIFYQLTFIIFHSEPNIFVVITKSATLLKRIIKLEQPNINKYRELN